MSKVPGLCTETVPSTVHAGSVQTTDRVRCSTDCVWVYPDKQSVPHCNVTGVTDGDDPTEALDTIKLTLPQQGTPPPATFTPVVKATQAVRHHEVTLTRWHSAGLAASETGVPAAQECDEGAAGLLPASGRGHQSTPVPVHGRPGQGPQGTPGPLLTAGNTWLVL